MVIAVEKGKRNANRCKTHAVNHVNAVYNDMETVSAFCIGILHIFPENTHRLSCKKKEGLCEGGQHIEIDHNICHRNKMRILCKCRKIG